MSTVQELTTRVQMLLLDTDGQSVTRRQLIMQLQDEMTRLSREQRYGDILIMQGVTGVALYGLPTQAVDVFHVLYNGARLDYATEEMLDRTSRLWEAGMGEPKYWTYDLQSPNVFRLVPAPRRTGSILPDQPPQPFTQPLVDNLCVFYWRDFSDQANEEVDPFPLLDVWQDVAVWRTTSEAARRESPYQNLPLSAMCNEFSELWLGLIEGR